MMDMCEQIGFYAVIVKCEVSIAFNSRMDEINSDLCLGPFSLWSHNIITIQIIQICLYFLLNKNSLMSIFRICII